METLKKIVSNQYFPAGAVLTAVLLFWSVGLLGGLSLLHNNQPPLTTLTWMLFVYMAAVLTPLAGILAAVDLVRRWRRNRAGAGWAAEDWNTATAGPAAPAAAQPQPVAERVEQPVQQASVPSAPAQSAPTQSAHQNPEAHNLEAHTPAAKMPGATGQPGKKRAAKKPAAKKQGSKKAA